MKIDLFKSPKTYSCNSYYLRGSWGAIPDVNTLIDVGTDNHIISCVSGLNQGVGKKKVDLVILTHEHFDHSAGLKFVVDEFKPTNIIAFKKLPFVTELAHDEMKLKIADEDAIIYHTPGHSNDSISIFFPKTGDLFLGDTPYNIKTIGGTYQKVYIEAMERLCSLDVKSIYSGHDDPITQNAKIILLSTLSVIRRSNIA